MHRNPMELHRAYKRLFESTDGRLVMDDLEKRGCFLHSTFATDRGRTEFNEGRRSLILHMKHMLDETNFTNKDNQE